MKRILALGSLGVGLLTTVAVQAIEVNFFVDAAPNAYGSPDWPAWRDNAFSTAANGTFINMEHSFNPANAGTTYFELEDAVVYSFGDLGRRLHFVYYVPGETSASLTASQFQLRLDFVWDGVTYEDFAWYTPSSWVDYDRDGDGVTDGVVGTLGEAWWGAYGINTPEALASDLEAWRPYQGDFTVTARAEGMDDTSLTAVYRTPGAGVPDAGSTLALLGIAVAGLGAVSRRCRKN